MGRDTARTSTSRHAATHSDTRLSLFTELAMNRNIGLKATSDPAKSAAHRRGRHHLARHPPGDHDGERAEQHRERPQHDDGEHGPAPRNPALTHRLPHMLEAWNVRAADGRAWPRHEEVRMVGRVDGAHKQGAERVVERRLGPVPGARAWPGRRVARSAGGRAPSGPGQWRRVSRLVRRLERRRGALVERRQPDVDDEQRAQQPPMQSAARVTLVVGVGVA